MSEQKSSGLLEPARAVCSNQPERFARTNSSGLLEPARANCLQNLLRNINYTDKMNKIETPEDFKKAVRNFERIIEVSGSEEKTVFDCELVPRREARRSLVLTRDMKAGDVIAAEDIMAKRPGTGIGPKFTDIIIGRTVKEDLAEDTVLTWDMV